MLICLLCSVTEIRERPPKKTPFRRYRDFHDFSNRNRKKTNETKRLTRYEYCCPVEENSPQTLFSLIHTSTLTTLRHFRKIIDELKLPDRHDRNADKMRIVRDWLYDEAKGKRVIVINNADDATSFS